MKSYKKTWTKENSEQTENTKRYKEIKITEGTKKVSGAGKYSDWSRERICELEDGAIEIFKPGKQKMMNEEKWTEVEGTRMVSASNCMICIVGVPEWEEVKRIFKGIMVENLPNLMKDMNLQIQEAQQTN